MGRPKGSKNKKTLAAMGASGNGNGHKKNKGGRPKGYSPIKKVTKYLVAVRAKDKNGIFEFPSEDKAKEFTQVLDTIGVPWASTQVTI